MEQPPKKKPGKDLLERVLSFKTAMAVLIVVTFIYIYLFRIFYHTNPWSMLKFVQDHNDSSCLIMNELCQQTWNLATIPSQLPHCVMSINKIGRLGNTMGQYATLLALARWNQRPAFMLPEMARTLRAYFQVTMPGMSEQAESCVGNLWTEVKLSHLMNDEYRSLDVAPEQPLLLTGYPYSWTFYDHIRQEIRNEFRLCSHIRERAQAVLRGLRGNRTSVTFVGVHGRRTDYVKLMAGSYKGVVGDAQYFAQAMGYFRSRYDDAIFVITSDDMEWFRKNIDNSEGDVHFAGTGVISEPINDLALLTQCNHSIITIGTYGYWGAYLAGGETVHLNNFMLPDSPFLQRINYSTMFLPSWKSFDANLTSLVTKT